VNRPTWLEAGPLRLCFERQGDRYAHRVELAAAGGWQTVLESLEGKPDEAWPPSPPLQSLHIEERPGGRRVALLVGMAGRSHWSLSVEADPAAASLAFDAACRLQEVPSFLGSRYRAAADADWSEERGTWVLRAACLELAVLSLAAHATSGSPRIELDRPSDSVGILVHLDGISRPQTLQWQFTLRAIARPAWAGCLE
jgi:hypothetical protein